MAPKKSTIVLNVEQFIHDIEERPAIWNRNFHCNKAFLEQMWDELSGTHKLPSKYGPLFLGVCNCRGKERPTHCWWEREL